MFDSLITKPENDFFLKMFKHFDFHNLDNRHSKYLNIECSSV